MTDRRKLKAESKQQQPDFLVTVQCACTINIYGTHDPDEAKTRAVNRVRGLFDGIDSELYIPRVMVIPGNMTPEELEKQLGGNLKRETDNG